MSDKKHPPPPTLAEVAEKLRDPIRAGFFLHPGRTLPKGHQWAGHDIPGRGQAARRRLRQLARLAAKD